MQTTRPISASIASLIPPAARGGLICRMVVSKGAWQLCRYGASVLRLSDFLVHAALLKPLSCMRVSVLGRWALRDKDAGGIGASGLDGFGYICEDGAVEVGLAGLLWVRSSHNLCTCEQDGLIRESNTLTMLPQRVCSYHMRWLAQRGNYERQRKNTRISM